MAFHKLSKYNDEDENSIHFITAKINKNKPFFKDENLCKLLIDEIKRIRKELGFKLLGYVIIYCHIHLLIYYEVKDIDLSVGVLPSDLQNNNSADKIDISRIMKRIKGSSSRLINKLYPEINFKWQKGFYDFNIYNDKKLNEKLDYIHYNPVKHNITDDLDSYKYSSYQNYYLNNDEIIEIDWLDD